MPKTRLLVEFGIGTSLRRQDYTEAACRAVRDALWRHSINVAELFGFPRDAMLIDVRIAVQRPEAVDADRVAALFPYGRPTVTVVRGGLDAPRPGGGPPTVIANAALSVSLAMTRAQAPA